jgi:hypothetical protein
VNNAQIKVLAGSILAGAGAICFALGDLASATNTYNNSAMPLGIGVILVGVLLGLSGLRSRDRA